MFWAETKSQILKTACQMPAGHSEENSCFGKNCCSGRPLDPGNLPRLSTAAEIGARADPLFVTILALDTRLFDAYNHCDLVTLGSMVSDDLEFYHDQTGLSVGKAPFLAAIKQNICGKVQRELLRNTLEVYPLKGYGAVEIGVHRFHHPGHPENVGDAKFIVLWRNEGGVWKVTRVISYEHNRGRLAK